MCQSQLCILNAMRSLSVGPLLVLLAVVSCGHKKRREGKDGSSDCVVYRSVCTETPQQQCRTQTVRRCFTVSLNQGRRDKRSPQVLQALLLYRALTTRHPERAEQRREVRCELRPRRSCSYSSQQSARRCQLQPVNIC